jgi:spermidine synthase
VQNLTKQQYLYFTVFSSGMTVLAIELSASRLLGSVFGTSNLVWANIIGLMLVYLTLGYFIGGRWADRSPNHKTLYQIICWGAFFSGIVPLVARPVLYAAAQAVYEINAGVAIGSFLGVLLLFSVPVTLLGCVSPFTIRLAITDVSKAGQISGFIYAISTLGSIIGTFAPTLFLIPEAGVAWTFLLFSGWLLGVGLIGLLWVDRRTARNMLWMPIVLVILAAVFLSLPRRPIPEGYKLLYEKESAYNYIQIVEDESQYRYLWLNEGQGIHTQYHPDILYYGRTWDMFLAAPYFNPGFHPEDVNSLVIIGLAGGTIARQHTAVYGQIPIDGIEIDRAIVDASRKYLEMDMPNLNVIVEDGRYAFNRLAGPYTVVGIDAYRVPYVPWQLTTVEFFEEIADRLEDNGVVVINVGRTSSDRRLEWAMANTMLQVFPSVHRIDVPDSLNTILVATRQPTTAANLIENFQALNRNTHPLLWQVLNDAVANLKETETSDVIFTDDRAPVETIVDDMTIEFFLSGEVNSLAP